MPTWLHGPTSSRCGAEFLALIALKYSVSAWGKPSYQPVDIVTGMSAWSSQKRV